MELTLDLTSDIEWGIDSFSQVEQKVLKISSSVTESAEKMNALLFAGNSESAFTVSVFGTLAIEAMSLGPFAACFTSLALADCMLGAREEFAEYTQEKSSGEVNGKNEETFSGKGWKNERSKHLFDLAMTNIACTALSNIIFASNTPALVALGVLSVVRIFQE